MMIIPLYYLISGMFGLLCVIISKRGFSVSKYTWYLQLNLVRVAVVCFDRTDLVRLIKAAIIPFLQIYLSPTHTHRIYLSLWIIICILHSLQICSTPDSNISSPSYTSSHSFLTLTADRPVTGQNLNSDSTQRNQDSTVLQAYPQNVSVILYFTF
jgi:hypothetical protein